MSSKKLYLISSLIFAVILIIAGSFYWASTGSSEVLTPVSGNNIYDVADRKGVDEEGEGSGVSEKEGVADATSGEIVDPSRNGAAHDFSVVHGDGDNDVDDGTDSQSESGSDLDGLQQEADVYMQWNMQWDDGWNCQMHGNGAKKVIGDDCVQAEWGLEPSKV